MGLMIRIDNVQLKIINALKDCKLDRVGAMNVLLSVTLSIAKEEAPSDPITVINDSLEEVQHWQDPVDHLLR
jgi:hypothetical protein